MPRATIIRVQRPELGSRVAEEFFSAALTLPTNRPIVVAVPGGTSMKDVFEGIAWYRGPHRALLRRTHWFQLDEYPATPERPEQNWDVIEQSLLANVSSDEIGPLQLHRLRLTGDRQHDLHDYAEQLLRLGGQFDVVFFGVGGGRHPGGGEDTGHVAALFPGFDAVWSSYDSFVAFDGAPKPPSHRITATPFLIRKAGIGIALILGEGKRNAYDAYLSDRPVTEVPSKLVDELPRGTVFTDLS